MNKQLTEKAIDIKGKKYVQVKDRVLYFNETYPNGKIVTDLISAPEADMVIFRAVVVPDVTNKDRAFTGYSQANWNDEGNKVNKTSAIENAETSAVGRALALMGIGVIDSIASVDEVNKAVGSTATAKQLDYLKQLITRKLAILPDIWANKKGIVYFEDMTARECSNYINELIKLADKSNGNN